MAEALYNRAVVFLLLGRFVDPVPFLSTSGLMGLYKAYNLLKQAKNRK